MEPPRLRVGPRESLTVTATVGEVDGWRVAARIAGARLAEWAVEALNAAANAGIAGRVDAEDGGTVETGERQSATGEPASAPSPLLPGPWGALAGPESSQGKGSLPPAGDNPPETRPEIPEAVLEGLRAVLEAGSVHCFIPEEVAEAATRLGFDEAARWVQQNPTTYVLGLFRGLVRRDR